MRTALKSLIVLVGAVLLFLDIVICVGLLKYGWQGDIVDVVITERGFEPVPIDFEAVGWIQLIAYIGLHILLGFFAWRVWRKPQGQPA